MATLTGEKALDLICGWLAGNPYGNVHSNNVITLHSPQTSRHRFVRIRLCHLVLLAALNCTAFAAEPAACERANQSGVKPPAEPVLIEPTAKSARYWSVQVGVAAIAQNDVGEIFSGGLESAEGEGAGQVYSLMLNWTAHRFHIPFRGRSLRPQFEPYLTLSLVDENGRSMFPDYNGGAGFRWVDFPWNKWVSTSFFMGVGLSYSSSVYRIDRVRHPSEERSHLKLDWPIQLTMALPRWPRSQLVLYNDHQSGGHIFDEGGVNSVGIGYRFEF